MILECTVHADNRNFIEILFNGMLKTLSVHVLEECAAEHNAWLQFSLLGFVDHGHFLRGKNLGKHLEHEHLNI